MATENNNIITRNVIIPRTTAWAFLGTVVLAVITAYVTLKIQIAHLEKDVSIVQRDIVDMRQTIKENSDNYKSILQELRDINTALQLKQDRKFVE